MSDARLPGASQPAAEPRLSWERALVWFMRLMALAWLAKGLASWAVILDRDPLGGPAFTALPAAARASVVVFAVLDLVAGVGLWLTSTWGGVMWLLAIMSHLLIGVLVHVGPLPTAVFVTVDSVAVAIYITLSWLASRES